MVWFVACHIEREKKKADKLSGEQDDVTTELFLQF